MADTPPKRRIRWAKSYRAVNSRFPPIDVFERVADPDDWDSLIALETLTNPRVRQEVGEIALVSPEERVSGPGASWLMAPFTHIGWPSRFTDGTWGVYYCARSLVTAVHEKAHHVGIFFASTNEPLGTTMEIRAIVAAVDARFYDVRRGYHDAHDPSNYGPGQSLARDLRGPGVNGIVYRSIRHQGGDCLAAFRPKALQRPISGPNLRFHFDGTRVDRWFHFGDRAWHALDG
ncbi:MAG: RES family NAD+ phosphorylase [Polyangiales bacterium]